ncbi:MAG: hypothetical protein ABJA67_07675 [Chthonomonadales bacterium]
MKSEPITSSIINSRPTRSGPMQVRQAFWWPLGDRTEDYVCDFLVCLLMLFPVWLIDLRIYIIITILITPIIAYASQRSTFSVDATGLTEKFAAFGWKEQPVKITKWSDIRSWSRVTLGRRPAIRILSLGGEIDIVPGGSRESAVATLDHVEDEMRRIIRGL